MLSLFKSYKTPSDEKLFENINRKLSRKYKKQKKQGSNFFFHIKGDGLKVDHEIIKRAHEEDGEALYLIGFEYFQKNTKTNHLKAKDWFLKSCNSHYAAAEYSMGFMYQKGFGVEPDHYKALEYFTLAAKQGQENAKKQIYIASSDHQNSVEGEQHENNSQIKKHKSKSKKREQIQAVFEDQQKELKQLQEQLEAERKLRGKEQTEREKEKEEMSKRVKLLERLVTQLAIEKKVVSEQDEKEKIEEKEDREEQKTKIDVNAEKSNYIVNGETKKSDKGAWADFQIR
ncbi:hypothetical protein K501DRAFT_278737 [Backusella circina FSU 941]|nr:hypothetical protein K501DRAFT_278737 [Backusella circina FSU 941]